MGEGRKDEAGNTTGGAAPPLTPLRGFILAVAVATLGGLVISGLPGGDGRRDGPSPATPTRSARVTASPTAMDESSELLIPDTDEALAIFTGLRDGLERVYRRRDLLRLSGIVKRGSLQFKAVRKDLHLLASNNLLDRTRIRRLGLEVVEIEEGRIVVRERVLIRPRYVDDATYVEADIDLERSRVTSEWTIEREGERWRIVGSRAGN